VNRITLAAVCLALFAACGESGGTSASTVAVPGQDGRVKSSATARAIRRAYDGSPPVIAHAPMGAACTQCHDDRGMEVPGLGYAPPSPHEKTAGLSALSRCEQCHVYHNTDGLFVATSFEPLSQELRRGTRLYGGAPPVIPHLLQMRENCTACHSGPAAREEIRCTHPERARCQQCHVPVSTTAEFARS
jgi:cytochrome c-type protein NapB